MAYAPSAASPVPDHGSANKPPGTVSNAPQGTFLPGTKVQVGSQRVIIEKYLSEGGFAHVYVVRVPRDNHKHELAVLKRVAVPDREHLANMRTEVETMKKVKGHKHVVAYIDSHASQLKGGGYEVFLLMEYCSGGGLIDFMNTRLQHRLTEPEILKIFGDVAEGVACMHYLKPPLLHRDLKVENVLIAKSTTSGATTYKICDFGSTAPPRPAAKTAEEGRLIEEDVQKHTTMQYRSPEMIDVWRKQPIDEKADIWALGVLLYKLCYYTTPFEDVGQMAILNASFKYPSHPSFSEQLKRLIGILLKENPAHRPNIYQVIKEVSRLRGTEVPIKDIYAQRTHSESRRNEFLPTPDPPMSVGLSKQAPLVQVQSIPDIAPMRRGRPTAPTQTAAVAAAKPSPSPARGDPFAALDSKSYDVRAGAVDELSKRFPSLDEFSIVHDSGGKFPFDKQQQQLPPQPADTQPSSKSSDLNERVTNVLADRVFSQSLPKPQPDVPKAQTASQPQQLKGSPPKLSSMQAMAKEVSSQSPLVHQPTPVKPGTKYISTATGTSPPPVIPKAQLPEISSRPIWKVPSHNRSSSQPRASKAAQIAASTIQPSLAPADRSSFLDIHRSKSQAAGSSAAKSPASSRPSLEGRRPSQTDIGEPSISRARSANSRQRPSSVYVSSNLDYLRDQETSRKRPSLEGRRHSQQPSYDPNAAVDDGNIDDDIDYLRNSEDVRPSRKSSAHKKRPSLSGAKQMIAGRFNDAFKRFENHTGENKEGLDSGPTTPPLPRGDADDDEPRLLSPIKGSEGTPSRHSDMDSAIDETEDLPPDVRRELERRRLSQEEKRVAEAAAEYKARLAAAGPASSALPTRATTIQKRVQSLLDEAGQSPIQPKRTAEGYGRYTDLPESEEKAPQTDRSTPTASKPTPPPIARKPITTADTSGNPYVKTRTHPPEPPLPSIPSTSASAPPTQATVFPPRTVSRPSVPPKSQALRTGGAKWPPSSSSDGPRPTLPKPTGGLAALLAKDLEGVPDYPPQGASGSTDTAPRPSNEPARAERAPEDLEEDFSKRYPALSGIEMEEIEIGGKRQMMSMRDV